MIPTKDSECSTSVGKRREREDDNSTAAGGGGRVAAVVSSWPSHPLSFARISQNFNSKDSRSEIKGDVVQIHDEHRQQVLKQQQQRLLLLRHASKCPNADCKVTQHCVSMKHLWEHIIGCNEPECKKPHCVTSRCVLSHYSKCKETNCPVCGPVRDAIRRHYKNSDNIIGYYSTVSTPSLQ